MWYDTKRMGIEVEQLKERLGNLPPEMFEERFREEAEAGWAKIEKCVLSFKAGENILSGGRFDTLSLGTWLTIAAAVDLTYVPAEIVALPKGMEIFRSGFAPIEIDLTAEQRKYRGVVRLDNCGSRSLKAKMGYRGDHAPSAVEGAKEHEGKFYFVFDDRTTHGVMEYVGQIEPDGDVTHPIWWRPWVKALTVDVPRPRFMGRDEKDTWPLEWRVIVQHGKIAAISAYYVQAPVTLSDVVRGELRSVVEQSNRLLAFLAEKQIQPWHPRYIDYLPEDEIAFSFDFISTSHGPAFLEAGPAVPVDDENIPVEVWGAHPCFFMGKKVSGIAPSRDCVIGFDEIWATE